MNFIVDAQLPKSLSDFLNQQGYDSIHTLNLFTKNKTPDERIIEIAEEQERIVITKDNDFLDYYLLKERPKQLILISTGNISNKRLMELFRINIDKIVEVMKDVSLIEMYIDEIIIHGSKYKK